MQKEKFPNFKDKNLGTNKEKLNKRIVESLALISMISIYSKAQYGEKILLRRNIEELPNFLHIDLIDNIKKYKSWYNMEFRRKDFDLLKRSLRRIEECPHIMYKTFCHRCPTPCFSKEDIEDLKPVMDYSKIKLLYKYPYTGFKFFQRIIDSKNLIKEIKKDADF